MNLRPPRIAYCSPVNPAASGISDYSEELLPFLGQYADVTLFVEDGLKPANEQLARHLEVLPLRRLEREQRKRPFDALVYHMGNSPAHAGIWNAAQRLPGVVVLHEWVLHHFMLWYAANVHHDIQHYVRDMAVRYGDEGEHIAQLMIRSRFTDAAFRFPCSEEVVAVSRGLIAHSRYVIERAAALRPTLPSAVVPMGVPLPPAIPCAEARARLGLPADALILASFGHINAYKRLEPSLRAFASLRQDHPGALYLLIGSASPNYDVAGLVARMGLADAVRITGFVSRADWDAYGAATDICLNLRHPTAGETSASLLRLLGAGKPTLVSATGSFAELPLDVAAPVDVDESEGALIEAYCRMLIAQPDVAARLGANARAFVATEHSLERSAQGYMRFLARLHGWPAVQRFRAGPLWEGAETRRHGDTETRRHGDGSSPPLPLSPSPCLLVSEVAQALADLGIAEGDEAILGVAAQRIAEVIGEEER